MSLMTAIRNRMHVEVSAQNLATVATHPSAEKTSVATVAAASPERIEGDFCLSDLATPCDRQSSIELSPGSHSLDRFCWPISTAMNSDEIGTFLNRKKRLMQLGIDPGQADEVVAKMQMRDRDLDDRICCLECVHLTGLSLRRCNNWQRAGVPQNAIPSDLVLAFQRCSGFRRHL
jgi:hypothetical protein